MLSQYFNIEPSLSLNEVLSITKCERAWLFELMKSGKFPKPDRKVGKNNYWSLTTIDKYLNEGNQRTNENILLEQTWGSTSFIHNSAIPCSMVFKY